MTIFLNLALLLIGATSTIAAFGGKTWREGPEPILERITTRGWISLFCLILAVGLGTAKEIRSQIADNLAKSNSEKEQAAAKAQARESELQMQLANAGVENLKLSAKGAQEKLALTESKLESAEAALNDVRRNLTSTRDDLQQESNLSLLSVLATAKLGVSDITLVVPFTSKATPAFTFYESFVPRELPVSCRDETNIVVILSTRGSDDFEFLEYKPEEMDTKHDYTVLPNSEINKGSSIGEATADLMLSGDDYQDQLKFVLNAVGQKSSNSSAFVAEINFGKHTPSASGLIKALQGGSRTPITITASTDKVGPDHPAKKVCSDLIHKYFAAAFDRAYMRLTLNNEGHLTLFYSLKTSPQFNSNGDWGVPFEIDSKPAVSANDELGELIHIEWPGQEDVVRDGK
jgi:hypothetical protein